MMKKVMIALTASAVCFGIAANTGRALKTTADSVAVEIADENLRSLLVETLSLSTDEITLNDMKSLTRLETPDNDPAKKIADLSGLEYASNLTYLDLNYNKITDLTPVKDLKKLETLDISYNNGAVEGTEGITDISCLSGLTNLKRFSSVGNAGIKDYSVVANFANLTYLNLSVCGIENVNFVKDLTSLEKLYLTYNAISDVSPIGNLTHLKTLALGSNNVYNIAALKNLTELEQFTVENNNLTDVSVVYGFEKLDRLDVSRNYLSQEVLQELMETVKADNVIIGPVKEGEAPADPNPPVGGDDNPADGDNTNEEEKPAKKGCFGSVAGGLATVLALACATAVSVRRKKEDRK